MYALTIVGQVSTNSPALSGSYRNSQHTPKTPTDVVDVSSRRMMIPSG